MIFLRIPGTPQPRQSVRACVRHGKIHTYQANDAAERWMDAVKFEALKWRGLYRLEQKKTLDCPLCMGIKFYFPRPKGRKGNIVAVKPDLDNLAKPVLDALQGVIFTNDSRIALCYTAKFYGEPRCEIMIGPVEEARQVVEWICEELKGEEDGE